MKSSSCRLQEELLTFAGGLAKILGEFGCAFLWDFVGFPCFDTEFSYHHDGNVL